MCLDKNNSFRRIALQVFGTLALPVLVPPPDQVIGAAGIEASVAAAHHIDKPIIHES